MLSGMGGARGTAMRRKSLALKWESPGLKGSRSPGFQRVVQGPRVLVEIDGFPNGFHSNKCSSMILFEVFGDFYCSCAYTYIETDRRQRASTLLKYRQAERVMEMETVFVYVCLCLYNLCVYWT